MTIFLGIDPGQSGGMAALFGTTVDLFSLSTPMVSWWDWLKELAELSEDLRGNVDIHFVIEKVGGYVSSDEGQSGMGPSMFSFGKNVGMLMMGLYAAGIRNGMEVTPQHWQRKLDVVKQKGEKKVQYKTRLLLRARQLFPGEDVNKSTCDALLLAHYCRMKVEGRIRV